MKRLSLNKKIVLALVASFIFSILCAYLDLVNPTLVKYLSKIGRTFVNALQVVAIPLVVFALIVGVNGTQDFSQFSRIGVRTMFFYILTTIFSATLGLLIGNVIKPGVLFNKIADIKGLEKSKEVVESVAQESDAFIPDNLFEIMSSNANLLSIVFFAIFFGVVLMGTAPKKKRFILMFCQANLDIFSKMLDYIMQLAPIGLFALISSQFMSIIQENPEKGIGNILLGLGIYTLTVVFGLGLLVFVLYPAIVAQFSSISAKKFLKTMRPAQLLAFSTASSTATLPKTAEQVGRMGVSERVRSFVLSLGATMNMDGTALYQSIATLFIMQVYEIELGIQQQLYIVSYITISVIGVAGVPGASFVTTSILLKTLSGAGMPIVIGQALALISIPDRILDMFRTSANITGDAAVAVIVEESEKKKKALA